FSPSGVDLGVFARGMELPRDVLVVRKPPRVFELPAVADSFMRQGAPNTNEGANPRLRIQEAGNNRALVAFELVGIPLNRITRATLVLTIAENADNWGRNNDRTVDAHRLLTSFIEGNGQAAGLSNSETARGSGSGVTWHCAADANVANQIPDCSARWNGGSFSPATAAAYTHVNGLRGDVTWDVTADVQAGATRWLIKKTNEALSGQVSYYSREGAGEAGNPELAPRLIVEVD
ncbi:MAG TPA: DNRLRE domain-containing protein, partial [Methylomirabilota bacterium]